VQNTHATKQDARELEGVIDAKETSGVTH